MRKTLIFVCLLAVLAACVVHLQRVQQESANTMTEPVLDFAAVSELAQADSNQSVDGLLKEYAENYNFHSLAFAEQRIEDLESQGLATILTGMQLRMSLGLLDAPDGALLPDPGKTYIVLLDDRLAKGIQSALQLALGKEHIQSWPVTKQPDTATWKAPRHPIVELDLPKKALTSLGLGFPAETIKKYSNGGYRIWLRPENNPVVSEAAVSENLKECQALGNVSGVIFGGPANEVLGYPDDTAMNATGSFLQDHHWTLGFIELPKQSQQKGIEHLVRQIPLDTARVFAVAPAHQLTLKPGRIAQMYSLASRERNARVLYLRPYPFDPSPEEGFENANDRFFGELSASLGDRSGPAALFDRTVKLNPILAFVMGAGSAAIAGLLLLEYVSVPTMLAIVCLLAGGGVAAASTFIGPKGQLLRTLIALGTASCASFWAAVHHFGEIEEAGRKSTPAAVLKASLIVWLKMFAISLAGAWLASAYLQETTFKLGLDTFRGVKLLTVGVPALVALAWMHRQGGLGSMLGMQIRLSHLIGLSVLLVVAVFYTLRTGNTGGEIGGDAMEYERILRVFLDQTLGVRPRFKEFMVAHPCMILAPIFLWMGARRFRELSSLSWVLILAGSTGLAGLGDTFAHIHTPLKISLIRCLMGAGLGALIGVVYGLALAKLAKIAERRWP